MIPYHFSSPESPPDRYSYMQSPYLGQPFLNSYFEDRLKTLADLTDSGSLEKIESAGGSTLAAKFLLDGLSTNTLNGTTRSSRELIENKLGLERESLGIEGANDVETHFLVSKINAALITSKDVSKENYFEEDIWKLVKQFELFGSLPLYLNTKGPNQDRVKIDSDLYFEFAITLCLTYFWSGNFQAISTLLKLHDSILANRVKLSGRRSYLLTASISLEIQTLRSIAISHDVDFSPLDLIINNNE